MRYRLHGIVRRTARRSRDIGDILAELEWLVEEYRARVLSGELPVLRLSDIVVYRQDAPRLSRDVPIAEGGEARV